MANTNTDVCGEIHPLDVDRPASKQVVCDLPKDHGWGSTVKHEGDKAFTRKTPNGPKVIVERVKW